MLFHIYLIIISLGGQPAGVLKSAETWTDKATCELVLTEAMVSAQAALDGSEDQNIKGHYAIADGQCLTEEEAGEGKAKESI